MNLTWLLVRKDVRRLRWPVAAWLVFLALSTVGLRLAAWPGAPREGALATEWIRTVGSASTAAGLVALCAVVVLAGVLGLEDRVVGSVSFWQTRPMSGGRLLKAKVISAVLMLVVAPVGVLLPVWLGCGFGGGEIVGAAVAAASLLGLLAVCALSLAALCENLGQQAFAALVWVGLTLVGTAVLPALWERDGVLGGVVTTREWVMVLTLLAAAVGALVWQYQMRRAGGGWAILAVGLAALVVVRLGWRWNWRDWTADPALARTEVSLSAPGASAQSSLPSVLALEVPGVAGSGELVVPWAGVGELRRADGLAAPVQFGLGSQWIGYATKLAVGPGAAGGGMRWEMATRYGEIPAEWKRVGAAVFVGRVEFVRLRPRVLYELPVREGAVAAGGASMTRVVGWDEKQLTLIIEERGLAPWLPVGRGWPGPEGFVLRRESPTGGREMRIRELGAAGAGGTVLHLRGLEVDPVGEATRRTGSPGDGAWLVKVRYEPVAWFERDFAGLPLQFVRKENAP